jgi:RNA polymerase sigma-70 factor (ECF subfamily)
MTDFTELDDDVLAGRIINDSTAYSILYNRYFQAVYRYIYHRVGNTMDAEDLTSKVFTKALDSLVNNEYSHRGKFSAWLFTIARHRVIDFYRTNKNKLHVDLTDLLPDTTHSIDQLEDLKHIGNLITQLDKDAKELLRLRFSAGLDFGTISRIVGRTEPSVKVKLYRAIKRLQDQWEEKNDEA